MTIRRWLLRFALLLPILASCQGATAPVPQEDDPTGAGPGEHGPGTGQNTPPPLDSLPRSLSGGERAVIAASNRFAFHLLRTVASNDTSSNVFLSPLSASLALGTTLNGARGETSDEMREVLGFGQAPLSEINASYRSLIDLLLGLDSGVDMRIASSIWAHQDFPFERSFFDTAARYFDARVAALDFRDPSTPSVINAWVDESTNGRIPSIVDSISDEVMFLINAIYFKGKWMHPFDPKSTRDATFTRADGSSQPVRMMSRTGRVRYLATPEVQAVDLPYGRGAFTMTVVLPGEGRSLESLLATLSAERWDAWIGQLREAGPVVEIPRFGLEYERLLKDDLRALGMKSAFAPHAANFRGMSTEGPDLYISEVKQKTFVEVNEEGTEAAAATSVGMMPASVPPTFRADRPFLVAIRERFSGTILFLARIGAPGS